MNRFPAASACDIAHHRNRFEPSVRAALALLDRVAEGDQVDDCDVALALQVTGDAEPLACEKRAYARQCKNARIAQSTHAVAGAKTGGPSWQRERHPWAGER